MASSANSVPCQGGQCRDSEVCPKARRQRWLEETERGREVELVRLQGSGSQPGELAAVGEPGVNSEDIQEARCDFFLAVFLGLLGLE